MLNECTPEVPHSPWRTAAAYALGPLFGLIGAADEMGGIVGFVLGIVAGAVFVLWMLS